MKTKQILDNLIKILKDKGFLSFDEVKELYGKGD